MLNSFYTWNTIIYIVVNNLNVLNSIQCGIFCSNDLKCAGKDFYVKKYIKNKYKICIYHKPLFFKFVFAILSEEPILSSFHNINIVFKLYLLSVAHKHKTCTVHSTTQNSLMTISCLNWAHRWFFFVQLHFFFHFMQCVSSSAVYMCIFYYLVYAGKTMYVFH